MAMIDHRSGLTQVLTLLWHWHLQRLWLPLYLDWYFFISVATWARGSLGLPQVRAKEYFIRSTQWVISRSSPDCSVQVIKVNKQSSLKASILYWIFCSFTGQQQHFRPFFDSRFTGHLLELRRKSDPFSMANPQGRCKNSKKKSKSFSPT